MIIFGFKEKILKKILVAFMAVAFASQIMANEFIEALRGGDKSGDINLLFDYNHQSSVPKNSSYLATSFGLYYKSAFYGYFRLHLGFRGALPLWEQNKSVVFNTNAGRGSATKDFWDRNIAMVARSYLEYFDGDTSIKAGRIEDKTDMIDRHFDGVWVANKSLGWLLIDFIYMNQNGRVLDRELSGFDKFRRYQNINGRVSDIGKSKYGGAYYLGLNFEVFKWLQLKAYGLTSPDIYSFIGGKVSFDTQYFLANAGFIGGIEHRYSKFKNQANASKFSHLLHIDASGRYDSQYGLFYATLGYRNTQGKAGIGSLNLTGNSFNPFFYFSGNALNSAKDLHLVYGKLGYKVDFLEIYLTYGYNFFKGTNTSTVKQSHAQGEVNLYFDWQFTEFTSVILYFLNTHGGKSAIPTQTSVGAMFKVSL